jgi:hypothetical protein
VVSRAGDIYDAVAQAAELASALGTQGEITPGQMEILFTAAARAVCPTVQIAEVRAAARVVLKEFELAMAGTCDTANQVTHSK